MVCVCEKRGWEIRGMFCEVRIVELGAFYEGGPWGVKRMEYFIL